MEQVSMMGDIYRKANCANVWLEPGTEGPNTALTDLKRLSATALLAMVPALFPQWREECFQKQIADLGFHLFKEFFMCCMLI